MSSAALQDLANRIATNTLTAAQQGALLFALNEIIPVFPEPDELSNSIPQYEEPLSRLWYTVLYSIDAEAGPPLPPVVSDVLGTAPIVVTPAGSVRTVSIAPASGVAAGSMSAADFAKLAALSPSEVTAVTASQGLASSGGATPNLTPAAGFSLVASVANAAALTALSVAGFPVGAMAFCGVPQAATPSFCAYFTLESSTGLAPDGSTIIASSNGAFVWVRGQTGVAALTQKQTAWFVDAAAGSDENTGLTSGTAVKNKAEITRRWGTTSPTLNGINVLITYVSPDAAGGNDPGIFRPNFLNGATLKHIATLPAAGFTGTLLAVTAKNRPGNLPLRSTFTTTTGAIAPFMMLVNATRGNSRAFVHRDTGGGLWQISQPFVPYAGIGSPVTTEVDTWANGDAISGFALKAIDLAFIGGQTIESQAGFAGPSHIVQQLMIVDPQAGAFDPVCINNDAQILLVETTMGRTCMWGATGGSSLKGNLHNCVSQVETIISAGILAGPNLNGGIFAGVCLLEGCTVGFDAIMGNSVCQMTNCTVNTSTCWDTGTAVRCVSAIQFSNNAIQYGGGTINAQTGTNRYFGSGGTAVGQFPLAGGLQIDGGTQAYSVVTAAGLSTFHQLALTPAALDAAAGAAGFGGLAFIPGVAGFHLGTTTP